MSAPEDTGHDGNENSETDYGVGGTTSSPSVGGSTGAMDGAPGEDPTVPLVPEVDSGRNVPAAGRIAFFLGQDTDTLDDFAHTALAGSIAHPPDGVTLYTSFLPTDLHQNTAPPGATLYLSGIEGPPADDGNGHVDFARTLLTYDAAKRDKVSLAVGLYLSDEWADCSNQPLRALLNRGDPDLGDINDRSSLTAQYRSAIDRLISYLASQNRPVFLRIGYEFDGPWNCYNQEFYKNAFRYIKSRIDVLGADQVATVWQAATYPNDGDPTYHYQLSGGSGESDLDEAVLAHYNGWYPGDDVVDWVGVSFFAGANYLKHQWSCQDQDKPWTIPDMSPRLLQDALADFGRTHGKPVMIAESAPQGFDLTALSFSCTAARSDHLSGHSFSDGLAAYAAYFDDYFEWIAQNADVVRVFSYINTDWQSQTRWSCAPESSACPQGYWGDTRLQANPQVMERFFSALSELPSP